MSILVVTAWFLKVLLEGIPTIEGRFIKSVLNSLYGLGHRLTVLNSRRQHGNFLRVNFLIISSS